MKKNKNAVILFFRILFVIIALNSFIRYILYKKDQKTVAGTAYELVGKTAHKGGRGTHYSITVKYQSAQHEIDVTSKVFHAIERGEYPELYYSERSMLLFSDWTLQVHLRVAILFAVLCGFTFIPIKYGRRN